MFDILTNTHIDKEIYTFIIFFILVSALAFFHTVFFSAFKKQITPQWLLMASYNVIGSILFFINPVFTLLWVIFLFASLVIIFILTAIFQLGASVIREIKQLIHKPEPIYKKIFAVLGSILIIYLFFSSGPFFFLGIFIIVIISNMIGGHKNRYLKLQAVLPTSKIRSMAMGLVEVEGTVKAIENQVSPISAKECIGYHYTIESIRTDSDGNKHYTTIHDETTCNTFIIEDETGSVEVIPDKLDFIMFPVDEQYSSGSRRYTQYILYEGDSMLLIGRANQSNGNPVITYESIKNIFALSPVAKINKWNRFKPLRSQILLYITVFGFLVGMIMILSIKEVDGNIIIRLPEHIFSWNF